MACVFSDYKVYLLQIPFFLSYFALDVGRLWLMILNCLQLDLLPHYSESQHLKIVSCLLITPFLKKVSNPLLPMDLIAGFFLHKWEGMWAGPSSSFQISTQDPFLTLNASMIAHPSTPQASRETLRGTVKLAELLMTPAYRCGGLLAATH